MFVANPLSATAFAKATAGAFTNTLLADNLRTLSPAPDTTNDSSSLANAQANPPETTTNTQNVQDAANTVVRNPVPPRRQPAPAQDRVRISDSARNLAGQGQATAADLQASSPPPAPQPRATIPAPPPPQQSAPPPVAHEIVTTPVPQTPPPPHEIVTTPLPQSPPPPQPIVTTPVIQIPLPQPVVAQPAPQPVVTPPPPQTPPSAPPPRPSRSAPPHAASLDVFA